MSGSTGRCGCAIAITVTVTVSASTMRCALGTWPVTAHTKTRGLPVVCCLCAVFDGGAGFTLTAILNHRSAGSGLLLLLLRIVVGRGQWQPEAPSCLLAPAAGAAREGGDCGGRLRAACEVYRRGARLHGACARMALTCLAHSDPLPLSLSLLLYFDWALCSLRCGVGLSLARARTNTHPLARPIKSTTEGRGAEGTREFSATPRGALTRG